MQVEFDLKAEQNNHGTLHIEFLDAKGNVASRIIVDSTANIVAKGGARTGGILKNYEAGKTYHIKAILSTKLHRAYFYVDGKFRNKRHQIDIFLKKRLMESINTFFVKMAILLLQVRVLRLNILTRKWDSLTKKCSHYV